MISELPEELAQRVRYYLVMDDFPAAKEIYDNWIQNHNVMKDSQKVK